MRDLFSGSLGRLNNHGGSRMFTTPNTIEIKPDYEVETDVPSVAEFVTCSLDGRLWIFQRSKRYYVAVFRWDEDIEKLVFVSTTVLSNETVIKRGVDWILTDKSLIQASDDAPYISRTEYESDDTSYIDKINQSYSFFTDSETWAEIQNGQILRVNGAPSEELQTLTKQNMFLVPFCKNEDGKNMSFHDSVNFFKIHCDNGRIYALNRYSCGAGYLLPYVFNQDGDICAVQCFISQDINREFTVTDGRPILNKNDGWDNLCIASWKTDSACVFTPENQNSIICKKAKNSQVTTLPQCEQVDFSADNGVIFFDSFTHSNLIINDNSASFLRDNLFYECRGLNQWITQSGKIDTISSQYVISSLDNGTLTTYIKGEFYRELLTKKTLPLSAKIYSGKRLSLHEVNINNLKSISVNTLQNCKNNNIYVNYDDVYLPIINIKLLSEDVHSTEEPIFRYLAFSSEDIDMIRRYVPQVNEHYNVRIGYFGNGPFFEISATYTHPLYNAFLAQYEKKTFARSDNGSDGVFLVYERTRYTQGTDYYAFFDTYSHLTFILKTAEKIRCVPLCILNDLSSCITDTDGNEICLRSIHLLRNFVTNQLIVIQTEINPSSMSKIWKNEGRLISHEMDLPQ